MNRRWAAEALCLTVALCATNCGGDESEDSDDSSSSGGGSGGGHTGGGGQSDSVGQPPSEPDGPEADGNTPTVLAVSRLFLGDTDRDGNRSDDAWRQYGYNLDGRVSDAGDDDHCQPVSGAADSVKEDGEDGIDNGFGHGVLSVMSLLEERPTENAASQIESGRFTYLIPLNNLGAGLNQTGVDAALLHGAPLSDPPLFDGTDIWPVTAESVNDGDLNDPRVAFPNSFVADGTWSSGPYTDFQLVVSISDIPLTFNLHEAVITMDVEGTGSEAVATNGIIAGVLERDELAEEFRRAAGAINPTFCSGLIIEQLLTNIRRTADIMSDGSNGDSSETCDGISVGLGFEARAVSLGEVAAELPPPDDPCD